MLFPVRRSSYISFAIGWEVSPVARNTITHGGLSVLFCKRCTSNFRLNRNSSWRSISGIGRSRESTSCRVGNCVLYVESAIDRKSGVDLGLSVVGDWSRYQSQGGSRGRSGLQGGSRSSVSVDVLA